MSSPHDYLTFISDICGKLKTIKRTGWVRNGVPLPESDADHMHRCCMCAMLLQQDYDHDDDDSTTATISKYHPSKVDKNKLLKMTVSHDLCEALAGDVTPHCSKELLDNKHANEQAAMIEIRKVVGDPLGLELFELWKEYEAQETVEAIYCKDIDKFEMIVQAYEYEKAHLLPKAEADLTKVDDVCHVPLRDFFRSTNNALKTPLFRKLDKEQRIRREEMLKIRGWDVTVEERQIERATIPQKREREEEEDAGKEENQKVER